MTSGPNRARADASAMRYEIDPPLVRIPPADGSYPNISAIHRNTVNSIAETVAPPNQVPTNGFVPAASISPTAPAKLDGHGM